MKQLDTYLFWQNGKEHNHPAKHDKLITAGENIPID